MTRQVIAPAKAFSARLKWWREHRGHSQLALSGAAEISQRHLSFLESGRAEPSRDMVLRLCAVLDVPLRQQNALMLAAGFAPVWRETADLLRRLMAYPDVPPLSRIASLETPGPVVCFRFRKGDDRLSLFTTIATLGTPQDVTLQDIRVESFFPSDANSADMFRTWADAAKSE